MRSPIEKRLQASVAMDAHNGNSFERGVCASQAKEAAQTIIDLRNQLAAVRAELNGLRGNVPQGHRLMVVRNTEIAALITRWEQMLSEAINANHEPLKQDCIKRLAELRQAGGSDG